MRTLYIVVVAIIALSTRAITSAQEIATGGSAAAIREVVSGKTYVGTDTLKFGESIVGSPGTFERIGRPEGAYAIGYGTILIRRGQRLHGHVTSVSVIDHRLYMSTETYRCGPELTPKKFSTPVKLLN